MDPMGIKGLEALELGQPWAAEQALELALEAAEARGAQGSELAELQRPLALAYERRGYPIEAEEMLERALSACADRPEAELERILTLLELARLRLEQGWLDEANPCSREASELAMRRGATDLNAEAFWLLTWYVWTQGDAAMTSEGFRHMLGLAAQAWGRESLGFARMLLRIGKLFALSGQWEAAVQSMSEALELLDERLGAKLLPVVWPLLEVADAFVQGGRGDEALGPLELAEAIEGKRGEATELRAKLLLARARALSASSRGLAWTEHVALLERALAVQEQTLGAEALEVAVTWRRLAEALEAEAPDRAESAWRRSLGILEGWHGPEHNDVAVTLQRLAYLLERQGRPGEALELLERAHAMQAALDPEGYDGLLARELGRVLAGLGRMDEAEARFGEAVEGKSRVWGALHFDVSAPLDAWASACEAHGRHAQARELRRRALRILEAAVPDWASSLATEHLALARLSSALGDALEAARQAELALDQMSREPEGTMQEERAQAEALRKPAPQA